MTWTQTLITGVAKQEQEAMIGKARALEMFWSVEAQVEDPGVVEDLGLACVVAGLRRHVVSEVAREGTRSPEVVLNYCHLRRARAASPVELSPCQCLNNVVVRSRRSQKGLSLPVLRKS